MWSDNTGDADIGGGVCEIAVFKILNCHCQKCKPIYLKKN